MHLIITDAWAARSRAIHSLGLAGDLGTEVLAHGEVREEVEVGAAHEREKKGVQHTIKIAGKFYKLSWAKILIIRVPWCAFRCICYIPVHDGAPDKVAVVVGTGAAEVTIVPRVNDVIIERY